MDTIATWGEARVRAWISRSATPDMAWGRGGSDEQGVCTYRISDADPSAAAYANATSGQSSGSPRNMPDVPSAPNGVLIAAIGNQSSGSVTATSLGMTEDYDGQGGSEGWYLRTSILLHLDGVTPNGSTLDTGTVTFSSGSGTLSNTLTLVVETGSGSPTEPAQVTGLTATPGNGLVDLDWDAPDDGGSAITDYLIEVNIEGAGWNTVSDGTSTNTSYQHTGLTNGDEHVYRVSAINAVGTGTASATASATPTDAELPEFSVFTSSGTFNVPDGVSEVDALVVAGGGGGGRAGSGGAGGGAGEVRDERAVAVTPGGTVTVTIGGGGAGRSGSTGAGASGSNSSFGAITAVGGGAGGGGGSAPALDGGSGGGGQGSSGGDRTGGTSTATGYGNDGGDGHNGSTSGETRAAAGGGGGAGGVGVAGSSTTGVASGGDGGPGLDVSGHYGSGVGLSGVLGGGGGGGVQVSGPVTSDPGDGGSGGGGAGRGNNSGTPGADATPNTGSGGGGGGGGTATNGGDGGSGLVVVRWVSAPPEPPDPETPVALASASTSSLADPTTRAAKNQRWQWWTGTRWDAVLPTGSGWRIATDLLGTPTMANTVDSRQDTRVDTVFHDDDLWVLRGHDTTPRITHYTLSGGTYTADAGITDVSLTALAASDHDASPIVLLRTSNGRLWATVNNGTNVVVAISDNDGDTWTTANVLSVSATGVVMLAQAASTLVLVSSLNDGDGRAVRTIGISAGSITSGNWSTETLPALSGGVTSDDHGMMTATPAGELYWPSKTSGGDSSGDPLIYLARRTTGGVWSQQTLATGIDNAGPTRPTIVTAGPNLRIGWGRNQTPTNAVTVTVPLDTLTPGSLVNLFTGGDWSDGLIPPREVTPQSGLLWLGHDRDTSEIWRVWEPVEVAPEEYDVTSTGTFTLSASGAVSKVAFATSTVSFSLAGAGAASKAGVVTISTPLALVVEGGEASKGGAVTSSTPLALVVEGGEASKGGAVTSSVPMTLTVEEGATSKIGNVTSLLEAALGLSSDVSKTAGTQGTLSLGMVIDPGDSDKETSTDASSEIELDISAEAAKIAEALSSLGLSLSADGTAVKVASATSSVGLTISVDSIVEKIAQTSSETELVLSASGSTEAESDGFTSTSIPLTVSGQYDVSKATAVIGQLLLEFDSTFDAVKVGQASSAIALALGIVADAQANKNVSTSMGLTLSAYGDVSALSEDSTVGQVALALAVVASAIKAAETSVVLPMTVSAQSTASKDVSTTSAVSLELSIEASTSSVRYAVSTTHLSLITAIVTAQAGADLLSDIRVRRTSGGGRVMHYGPGFIPTGFSSTHRLRDSSPAINPTGQVVVS